MTPLCQTSKMASPGAILAQAWPICSPLPGAPRRGRLDSLPGSKRGANVESWIEFGHMRFDISRPPLAQHLRGMPPRAASPWSVWRQVGLWFRLRPDHWQPTASAAWAPAQAGHQALRDTVRTGTHADALACLGSLGTGCPCLATAPGSDSAGPDGSSDANLQPCHQKKK